MSNELYQAVAANEDLAQHILSVASTKFHLRKPVDTFDLFPFYSILVSTGGNKNTDWFDPIELWRARNSPEDKPLNLMHNQKRIVGHILENIVVGEDLKPIPEDTDEGDLPYKLHIITSSVIYKIWEDPVVQAEINKIIAEIEEGGKWAVSMECLFRNFDYVLTNAKGENKIVARTPETSSLTRFLRQYKGPGKIHGFTLGRLLRQITFSGHGLVDNPANPESQIDDHSSLFTLAIDGMQHMGYTNADSHIIGETIMAKETEMAQADVENHPLFKNLMDKHNRLQKDHDNLQNHANDMKAKLDHIHEHTMAKEKEDREKLEKENADLKTSLAKKDEEIEDGKKKVDAAENAKASLQGENEAMKKTLDEYKSAQRSAARIAALMDVDKSLTREKAEKTVADIGDVSDETFKTTLALLKDYTNRAPQPVTVDKVMASAEVEKDQVADINSSGVTNKDKTETTRAAVADWWKSQKKDKEGA